MDGIDREETRADVLESHRSRREEMADGEYLTLRQLEDALGE